MINKMYHISDLKSEFGEQKLYLEKCIRNFYL